MRQSYIYRVLLMLAIHADTMTVKEKEARKNITRADCMYVHTWQTSGFLRHDLQVLLLSSSPFDNERLDALP